jgi:hypothetical protein
MAGQHHAEAVAMTTGPALALSWAQDDLAGWAALWAVRKQREGSGMEGLARLGSVSSQVSAHCRIGVRKLFFFSQSFHNLQTNLISIQI